MLRYLLLFLAAMTLASSSLAAAERPNFIIIIGDDVGWNDIGPYGHPHVKTPNLDRMAKVGMRFDAAFLTCSSCSPSRCSIMTGRFPHNTGAAELHMPLPADQIVFAGLLKEAGYYTGAAGKWHLGKPAEVNFDRIMGGGPSGCENWEKMISERPMDKPFFFWLASFDAHRPYKEGTIDQPHGRQEIVVPPFLPDEPPVRDDLGMYYDEISRLDDYTGKVMALLKKQNVLDNTFILFMADNGRPFPRSKITIYDSGVKTPFIVQWPGHVKAGATTDSLISSIDIAPTILQLAGLPVGPSFQGKSFAPILENPKAQTRDYVVSEHNWHDYKAFERSVRSKQFLYIYNALPQLTGSPPADAVNSPTFQTMLKLEAEGKLPADQRGPLVAPRPQEELYEVVDDPYQLKNLVDDPAYAKTLATMRQEYQAWKNRTEDEMTAQLTPDKFDRRSGQRLPEFQNKKKRQPKKK
ncbi:sulfatase family protein [Blastopirellula retiformator]|uniref:Arylsulfatase n=1 Tax=Blastopirellula retiformator TaxID=2527970 RepID=A0A5C5VA26_9BACT|nr:sulfatase [Blastopirellula retiformator]TWT34813.1 Arylsulfatase precursor [Blastopirellula retiformator]